MQTKETVIQLVIGVIGEKMDVYPVDWVAQDSKGQYTIYLFGKTEEGLLVTAHIPFNPFFYVEVKPEYATMFMEHACKQHGALKDHSVIVQRVSMWGFTNMTKMTMARLEFATRHAARQAAEYYASHGVQTFESSADPLLRFFHARDIRPAHWVTLTGGESVPKRSRVSRAPEEIVVMCEHVSPCDKTCPPPLIIASWDLECYSADRKFVCADKEEDCIIQIAVSFARYNEDPYRQVVLCLGDTAPVEGLDIRSFETEHEMINAWIELVAEEDADVLLGYNTDQVLSI